MQKTPSGRFDIDEPFIGTGNPLCKRNIANEYDGAWSQEYMRYAIAMKYCTNKRVLDASAGTCFGSSALSMRASDIVCANVSADELDYGREMFKFYCPVLFVACDFNVAFPEYPYDTIVSIETIEHLKDPTLFINNCVKNLARGGHFIFSLPIGEVGQFHLQAFHNFAEIQLFMENHIGCFRTEIEWYSMNNCCVTNREIMRDALDFIGIWQKK